MIYLRQDKILHSVLDCMNFFTPFNRDSFSTHVFFTLPITARLVCKIKDSYLSLENIPFMHTRNEYYMSEHANEIYNNTSILFQS